MKFNFALIKRFVLLFGVMLFIIPQSLMAQREKPKNLLLYDQQPYHWGFIIATNTMYYTIDYKPSYQLVEHSGDEINGLTNEGFDPGYNYYVRSITPTHHVGFTVGVVGDLRLGKYFNLRFIPSLSFNTRILKFDFYREAINDASDKKNINFKADKSIFSTFIELPLQVKYKSKRLNNVAAYIIAGANFKIDLASQKKDKNTELDIITNTKVKKTDIAAEIGAGFDFYTHFFKFGIEAKMSYGLLNILDHQGIIYDSSINNMYNRTFQVSLTFE